MSSKFFTWTKGDRRNASDALRASGIVPIPAECISIKGVDYGATGRRSVKPHRRPSHLVLDGNASPTSKHSSRTTDSIALHDAAVQSATSLMAVMNDMLRSPPMSAHVFSQTYPPRLRPMHGRPRSQTAPSTPLVEAPEIEYAELPGSFPFDRKPSRYQLRGGQACPVPEDSDYQAKIGVEIARPHSSPQHSPYTLPHNWSGSAPHLSPGSALRPQAEASLRNSTSAQSDGTPPRPTDSTETTLVTSDAPTLRIHRPVYSPFPEESQRTSSLPVALSESRSVSANAVMQTSTSHSVHTALNPVQASFDVALFEEIARLRQSHEAHICSLKEAHEKELSSQRHYISFLEKRKAMAADEWSGHDQRVQSSNPDAQHTGHDRSAGISNTQPEQDELQGAANKNSRKTQQLEDVVQKSKDNERALKNAIADLEARLIAANNERTDVLEGYHEACAKIRELSESNTNSTGEAERLGSPRIRHRRAVSDVSRFVTASNPLWQQMQDLRRLLAERDARIKQLGSDVASKLEITQTHERRVAELEDTIEKQQQMVSGARADAERYNSLLHHELRRQSRAAAEKPHSITPKIEAEAFVVATEKMIRLKAQTETMAKDAGNAEKFGPQSNVSDRALEGALEHCIREIIMYKLDAKSYRKELRKAQAKIESLQPMDPLQRPPTPDGESAASGRSQSSPELIRSQLVRSPYSRHDTPGPSQSGLGIAFAGPDRTSTRSVASATAAALLSPTPEPHRHSTSVMSSPTPSRPRTPLGVHKKLPKPPPSPSPKQLPATPPPSNVKVQRTETPRSLSESIISSYAKRTTPEPDSKNTTFGSAYTQSPAFEVPRTPISKLWHGRT